MDVSSVSCAKRERESSVVSRLWVRRREEVRSEEAERTMSSCVDCFGVRLLGRRLAKRAVRSSDEVRVSLDWEGELVVDGEVVRAVAAAWREEMWAARSCSRDRSALRFA